LAAARKPGPWARPWETNASGRSDRIETINRTLAIRRLAEWASHLTAIRAGQLQRPLLSSLWRRHGRRGTIGARRRTTRDEELGAHDGIDGKRRAEAARP
jgi:hypothetical protein